MFCNVWSTFAKTTYPMKKQNFSASICIKNSGCKSGHPKICLEICCERSACSLASKSESPCRKPPVQVPADWVCHHILSPYEQTALGLLKSTAKPGRWETEDDLTNIILTQHHHLSQCTTLWMEQLNSQKKLDTVSMNIRSCWCSSVP